MSILSGLFIAVLVIMSLPIAWVVVKWIQFLDEEEREGRKTHDRR